MKKIYCILFVVLLACGCEKNAHVPDIKQDSYIFFDTEVVSTKGTLIEGETLPSAAGTSFGVFGYRGSSLTPVFSMYTVGNNGAIFDYVAKMYRKSAGEPFVYDALALWNAEEHSFYAYYPYSESKEIISAAALDASDRPYITYNQPTDLDKMADIMTAAALNKTYDDTDAQPVQLKFEHRLFAFDIVVNNEQSSSARNLKVKDAVVEFYNVTGSASLYFTDSNNDNVTDFTPAGTANISHDFVSEQFSIGAPAAGTTSLEYNFNEGNSFLFLPCTSLEVKFTLTFINAWNEECTYTLDCTGNNAVTPKDGETATSFKPGNKYALVIHKKDNGQYITFKPEIQDWGPFTINHTFN